MNNQDFINKIVPFVQHEVVQRGHGVVSAIVAQACLESKYGKSTLAAKYNNFFGLKAGTWKNNVVSLVTKEEYKKGVLVKITANFRTYRNMSAGIAGYFDFISTNRYKAARSCKDCETYLQALKNAKYATASNYVKSCMAVVQKYNLTKYDVSCPYPEPTYTVIKGEKSLGVFWLQWHLNKLLEHNVIEGKYLKLDGSFELLTLNLFTKFQLVYPETGTDGKPDGKCGPASRKLLKSLTMSN